MATHHQCEPLLPICVRESSLVPLVGHLPQAWLYGSAYCLTLFVLSWTRAGLDVQMDALTHQEGSACSWQGELLQCCALVKGLRRADDYPQTPTCSWLFARDDLSRRVCSEALTSGASGLGCCCRRLGYLRKVRRMTSQRGLSEFLHPLVIVVSHCSLRHSEKQGHSSPTCSSPLNMSCSLAVQEVCQLRGSQHMAQP